MDPDLNSNLWVVPMLRMDNQHSTYHYLAHSNYQVFQFPFFDLVTQRSLLSSDVMQWLGSMTLGPSWLSGMSLEIVIMGTLVQSSLLLQDGSLY